MIFFKHYFLFQTLDLKKNVKNLYIFSSIHKLLSEDKIILIN
jgi:hypothetical protein